MAVTEVATADVAQALVDILGDVDGLRTVWYVPDNARPPCAVLGLPRIDFKDPDSTFCWATWDFPITVIVSRNNDAQAQTDLSRLVRDVAVTLDTAPTPPDIFSIELGTADPTTATIAGQELPAYLVRVQVRA